MEIIVGLLVIATFVLTVYGIITVYMLLNLDEEPSLKGFLVYLAGLVAIIVVFNGLILLAHYIGSQIIG